MLQGLKESSLWKLLPWYRRIPYWDMQDKVKALVRMMRRVGTKQWSGQTCNITLFFCNKNYSFATHDIATVYANNNEEDYANGHWRKKDWCRLFYVFCTHCLITVMIFLLFYLGFNSQVARRHPALTGLPNWIISRQRVYLPDWITLFPTYPYIPWRTPNNFVLIRFALFWLFMAHYSGRIITFISKTLFDLAVNVGNWEQYSYIY